MKTIGFWTDSLRNHGYIGNFDRSYLRDYPMDFYVLIRYRYLRREFCNVGYFKSCFSLRTTNIFSDEVERNREISSRPAWNGLPRGGPPSPPLKGGVPLPPSLGGGVPLVLAEKLDFLVGN